jgi:threonine/homoserine/homoserine lactone efflux protein
MSGWEFTVLLVAWAVAGGSPGPATLAIAGTAMERGRSAGLAVATGIICGSAAWGIAAALGMSALMLAHVWVVDVLRYVGAAYLLFLAVKAMRSAMSDKPLATVGAKRGSLRGLFMKGFLVHITNPKAIFAWGAIFAIAVPPGSALGDIAVTFGALITVSCCVFWGYGVLFSLGAFVRGYQRMRRWFEGAFAVLFGAAGLKILTTRLA